MRRRSGSLQKASHRRCVTPLVTFVNFSGHSSAKSRKSSSRMICEWMAATPLTVCDAMTPRYAIRTIFSPACARRATTPHAPYTRH